MLIKRALILTLLFAGFAAPSFAADTYNEKIIEAAKKNIILTLNGVNGTMQAQALETLLELKKAHPRLDLNDATPSLIHLLDGHRSISVRILAALTLSECGDPKGTEAIRKASTRDSNKTVRRICSAMSSRF